MTRRSQAAHSRLQPNNLLAKAHEHYQTNGPGKVVRGSKEKMVYLRERKALKTIGIVVLGKICLIIYFKLHYLLDIYMELKVIVEGIERSVTGITEQTTCAQIIYALAHATSQKGRFIMLEKFRNAERRLSPNDKPLEVLQKWSDKAPNVMFVMKRVESEDDVNPNPSTTTTKTSSIPTQSRSTTSLPAYNIGTLTRNRPPPPDYNTVMEQKFASLSRGTHSRPSLPIPQAEDITIAKMGLSHNDLMNLIEKQRQTIEKQRENLFNAELMLPSPTERELLQLERQQDELTFLTIFKHNLGKKCF
uniref:Ras-associating domain-containing protein n=1 Tax=Heterorhabditis bacteriophora TaxID=37862 RepID=A0A1I7WXV2_HETBA